MTISQYLNRIIGTSFGKNYLQISIKKSFESRNFQSFWRNWNPVVGYYLAKYINKPILKMSNASISSFFTFLISGFLLHDLWFMPILYLLTNKLFWFPVTIIFLTYWFIMLVENKINFRNKIKSTKKHIIINIFYVIGGSILGGLISSLI